MKKVFIILTLMIGVTCNVQSETTDNDYLQIMEKTVRDTICDVFSIPKSKWPRRYPPMSSSDTIFIKRIDENESKLKFENLNETLNKYASLKGIKVSNFNEYSEKTPSEKRLPYSVFESYSHYLIKELIPDLKGVSSIGNHGYGHSFSDDDILRIHPNRQGNIKLSFYNFNLGQNGKSIMLQPATRGCTAAVTAMLIYDAGGKINLKRMRKRNLGNDELMLKDFDLAGFQGLATNNFTLEELAQSIKSHGPAIVGVNRGIGGHSIIVDDVQDDYITIRDPAHGWMIDIKPDSLQFEPTCLHISKKVEES
ncbi:hypothetical protein F0225_04055 [Vibrio pectenicida]|uniref:Peptidase C39 domain-containing protein n=1 Tax=Vibrio pectenicida TaxID=62763 RepID=A0A7Y3ZWS2_9VIBR|nr:papain-like cysteine protease family protein [Vibrio pectenicida]NOH70517.1 hypothetical protein [Vibrio pectenicida]